MAPARYPWKLLPRLASAIEHGQREQSRRDLDALLQLIAESSGNNLTLRKLRCAQLVSACLRGAHSGGAASEALLKGHLQFLKVLTGLRTWAGVARRMHGFVSRLLRRVRPANRSHMERVVAQVRQEIRTTAGITRPLAQHAAAFEVSVGYLSRSFAAIAGRTFREELRRVRIETAGRLLRETGLKISAIAGRVGLRDSSQFIADFRAETGVTPGEYRKQHKGAA
ncbi:MAG: helix-turn-helix transcriptional regulator [Verrucomicrobia bacterium]|nr:helix-turn-helix transcriptional regulator [Verrucomicrobiota bacterium]